MLLGQSEIERPLALAPMEDVSDVPFRLICKKFGADVVYTEFANCEALIRNVKRSLQKIEICESERPVGIQIYGSVEASMAEAARVAESVGPDFIDINCGCWVKKVALRGDGAGLLRDIKKFEKVVQSVVQGTSLPVTVKTRLGWEEDDIIILEVARMLEQNGVQALTVHCRTRKQGYTGSADWSWLPKIKAVTDLPLIANGDLATPKDVAKVFEMGCDGAMIGRAAIGNPWFFSQVKGYLKSGVEVSAPTARERIEMCIRHLRAHAAYRGEGRGVSSFRKFYAQYLRGIEHSSKVRIELMAFYEVEPIVERLLRFLESEHIVAA